MVYCDACIALARSISTGQRTGQGQSTQHSSVDVLHQSAKSCCFCRFFLDCIGSSVYQYTDRTFTKHDDHTVEEKLRSYGFGLADLSYSLAPPICYFEISSESRQFLSCQMVYRAEPVDQAAASEIVRPTTPIVDATGAIAQLKSWLKTCEQSHDECEYALSGRFVEEEQLLPKRILDLKSDDALGNIRLTLGGGRSSRYIALSHCWGPRSKQPLRTVRSNLQSHLRSIELAALPRTFQDVVAVARGIGIRYVWIDSLCIIQDDDADWREESVTMGSIYSGAFMTIAASGARDSTEGLFVMKTKDRPTQTLPFYATFDDDQTSGKIIVRQIFDPSPVWSPLRTRGWVVQEWRLSRRIVHFSEGGILWRCTLLRSDEFGRDIDTEEFHEWDSLLENYSQADFTFEKDRLVALEGLVAELKVTRDDEYFFGHWSADFPMCLLWMRACKSVFGAGVQNAPSWSWASKLGQKVFWRDLLDVDNIPEGLRRDACSVDSSGELMIRDACLMPCRVLDEAPSPHQIQQLEPGDYEKLHRLLMEATDYNVETVTLSTITHNSLSDVLGVAVLEGEHARAMHCLFVAQTSAPLLTHEMSKSLPASSSVTWVLLLDSHDGTSQAVSHSRRTGIGILFSSFSNQNWTEKSELVIA